MNIFAQVIPLLRILRFLLGSLALASLVSIADESGSGGIALHPTWIISSVEGKNYPILSVSGQKPQVLVDGKQMTLGKQSSYSFARSQGFAPGYVNVIKKVREFVHMEDSAASMGDYFNVDYTVSEDVKDCFLAVIFLNDDFARGLSDEMELTIKFKNLGDLEKGKKLGAWLNLGDVNYGHGRYAIPLFFTQGREMQSSESELSARVLRRIELKKHARIVTNYLSASSGKTAPPQPYVRVAPIFLLKDLEGVALSQVKADFKVGTDGLVSDVRIKEELPEKLKAEVVRSLEAWLFLPKLISGVSMETKVSIPLQLKAAEQTLN